MIVEVAQRHDRDYVFDTWKRSYRLSPRTAQWAPEAYDAFQQRAIERILPRSIVFVARPEGWAEGILGWACVEFARDAFVLHYGYTKKRLRGQGIFWTLVRHAQGDTEHERMVFTHLRPPYTNTLAKHGFVHAPERAEGKSP